MSNGNSTHTSRKFVTIPIEIFQNTDLSPNEKFLLAEINGLANYSACYASNKYFAEYLKVSVSAVEKMIAHLKEMGYIKIEKHSKTRFLSLTDPETFSNVPQDESENEDDSENMTSVDYGHMTSVNCGHAITSKKCGAYNNIYNISTHSKSKDIYNTSPCSKSIENDIKENNKDNILRNMGGCAERNSTNPDEIHPDDLSDNYETDSFRWTDKMYRDYIERMLPKYVASKTSLFSSHSNAGYHVFLNIFRTYFKYYRMYNGKYHVWYKEELIHKCIDNLFEAFGSVSEKEVTDLIQWMFEKKRTYRDKYLAAFCHPNTIKWLVAQRDERNGGCPFDYDGQPLELDEYERCDDNGDAYEYSA